VGYITAPPLRKADLVQMQRLRVRINRTADALLASQVGHCDVFREAFNEISEVQSWFMAACSNLLQ